MGAPDPLSLRRLKAFQPLNRLTDDQLVVLASRAQRRSHGPGQRVAERGVRDGLDYFLVSGAVELRAQDGRRSLIEAETDKALTAVARLQPRMYDVIAVRPSEFLVIEQEILNQLLRTAPQESAEPEESALAPGAGDAERVMTELLVELRANQVRLPSVPDVAMKVRRVVDRENTTAEQVAAVVSADPAMAAKLVRACNSPLYRGFGDVRNVREAVVRLGLNTTRQLVTVFALREVFKTRQPALQQAMDRLWQDARELAALCRVLAERIKGIDPEEALLAGLLHDIGGVPVLVKAEQHARLVTEPEALAAVIRELRADVGAAILESWSFPATVLASVRHGGDWRYASPGAAPQLVDVVILARLHQQSGQSAPVPALDEVPAYRRLGAPELDGAERLQWLSEAQARLDDVKQLLALR